MEAGSSKALRARGVLIVGLAVLLAGLAFVASSPGASSSPSPAVSSSVSGSPSPAASSPATTPAATPSTAPSGPAPSSPGAATYQSACAPCHGPQGDGIPGDGPSLKAAAFPDMVAQKVEVGGGGMPPFGTLSAAQIQAVSDYVAQQLADPTARQAQVGEGGEWYRLYCSGCHGATGRGGEMSSAPNAPSFAGMPPANALAGMEIGPLSMPTFASTLNERQKAAISLYVQVLVSPEHPGGNGLGFMGPVVEGAVAWFFFVVLVLIAVWLAWGKGKERA